MELKDLIGQELFFKDNFNIDECLSNYTHKCDLETLRRELKSYGVDLQQQMSDILKTETEAIVTLAEHLTNLQYKIENLQQPICQLREEILLHHNLTDTAEKSYDSLLKNIKLNNTGQNNIQLKKGILLSSVHIENFLKICQEASPDLLALEHIISKFSFQKYYMQVLNIITPDIQEIITKTESRLINIVNAMFLQSFATKDINILKKCLQFYNNLDKQNIAHETLKIHIIKPYLEGVLTEKSLEQHNQNLDEIYSDILTFTENVLDPINKIIWDNPDLKSYNFMLHSFWKEFDRQSRLGLPYITAPGNPELFKKRFNSTFQMVQNIASKCGCQSLFRTDETFREHLKRFNLPVYFEIQYQKIASGFEADIMNDSNEIYATQNSLSCKLKSTFALYVGIRQCFHKDVYIDQLGDQFLKLSLMLLSRYLNNLIYQVLQDSSFTDTSKSETFIMDSLHDLSLVEKFFAVDIENKLQVGNTLFNIGNPTMRPIFVKIFKANDHCIRQTQNQLIDHLVKMKLQESIVHLHNVGAIPRLYRRTNRSAPNKPSQYIVEAVKSVLEFKKNFFGFAQFYCENILKQIIQNMTNKYHGLVQEVLKSVCKTENSLRRLKNRHTNSNDENSSNSETISDEMKIREQIKFDVNYFIDKLQPLSSDDTKTTMDILKSVI